MSAKITLLSQETIDKIAAGEVIERPSSVVKELVENAIDAGATAITIEIKEGGISLIRITDNGSGIAAEELPTAFLRHSTSKIRSVEDLLSVRSLGFRGEALSSIAAVARVEVITKTSDALMGSRYIIEGSRELAQEEVGAPNGTTFLVKDLFYNTPARRKFLKTAHTEGSYVADLVEKLALSHPDISFKFVNNGQTKLRTSGNGNTKDLIYHIYGRDITRELLPVEMNCDLFSLSGFIAKPSVTRGNRNFENYFINERYVKSSLIAKAIEEAYKNFIMQHQYPFTVLYFQFDSALLDVNVHPSKMELRFERQQEIYRAITDALFAVLSGRELISRVPVTEEKTKAPVREVPESVPEPFEKKRMGQELSKDIPDAKDSNMGIVAQNNSPTEDTSNRNFTELERTAATTRRFGSSVMEDNHVYKASANAQNMVKSDLVSLTALHNPQGQQVLQAEPKIQEQQISQSQPEMPAPQVLQAKPEKPEQLTSQTQSPPQIQSPSQNQHILQEPKTASEEKEPLASNDITYEEITLASLSPEFLSQEARTKHRIIGQLFETYWLIEYQDQLYIIDQHAAHEKVLYERMMKRLSEKEFTSQYISPPILLTLDNQEIEMLEKHRDEIERFGYEVEPFGGKEYRISAIPDNLYHMDMKDLFIEMLDDFSNLSGKETPQLILEKVASMSCKAAVKGNNRLSLQEADALITELLTLENPYNCPHGRPTIIAMTKYEIEKKFKRIV